jgi:hypothetical protein
MAQRCGYAARVIVRRAKTRDPEGYRQKRRVIAARYRRRKRDRLWGFALP